MTSTRMASPRDAIELSTMVTRSLLLLLLQFGLLSAVPR